MFGNKKNKNKLLLKGVFLVCFIVFVGVFLFGLPSISLLEVQAQADTTTYTPLAPLPGATTDGETTDWGTYIQGTFILAIAIAGILSVIMITVGGIQYMTTDAISGKEEGKDTITKAVLGLILALASVLILYTINPNILNLELNPPEPDIPGSEEGSLYVLHRAQYVNLNGVPVGDWQTVGFYDENDMGLSYPENNLTDCENWISDEGLPNIAENGVDHYCVVLEEAPVVSPQFPQPINIPQWWGSGYSNISCHQDLSQCQSDKESAENLQCGDPDNLPTECISQLDGYWYCTVYGFCPPSGEENPFVALTIEGSGFVRWFGPYDDCEETLPNIESAYNFSYSVNQAVCAMVENPAPIPPGEQVWNVPENQGSPGWYIEQRWTHAGNWVNFIGKWSSEEECQESIETSDDLDSQECIFFPG